MSSRFWSRTKLYGGRILNTTIEQFIEKFVIDKFSFNQIKETLSVSHIFTYESGLLWMIQWCLGHSDTGLALLYAVDFVLRSSNGDRRAPNTIIVVTDSEAYDDETIYLTSLTLQAEKIPVSC